MWVEEEGCGWCEDVGGGCGGCGGLIRVCGVSRVVCNMYVVCRCIQAPGVAHVFSCVWGARCTPGGPLFALRALLSF